MQFNGTIIVRLNWITINTQIAGESKYNKKRPYDKDIWTQKAETQVLLLLLSYTRKSKPRHFLNEMRHNFFFRQFKRLSEKGTRTSKTAALTLHWLACSPFISTVAVLSSSLPPRLSPPFLCTRARESLHSLVVHDIKCKMFTREPIITIQVCAMKHNIKHSINVFFGFYKVIIIFILILIFIG